MKTIVKIGLGMVVVGALGGAGYFLYKKWKQNQKTKDEKSLVDTYVSAQEVDALIQMRKLELQKKEREDNVYFDDTTEEENEESHDIPEVKVEPEVDPLPKELVYSAYRSDILAGCSDEAKSIINNLWDVHIPKDWRFEDQELNIPNAELYIELIDKKRQSFEQLSKEADELNFVDFLMWAVDEYMKMFAVEKHEAVDNMLVDGGFWDIYDENGTKEDYENLAVRMLKMDNKTRSLFLPEYIFTSFKEELEAWKVEVNR